MCRLSGYHSYLAVHPNNGVDVVTVHPVDDQRICSQIFVQTSGTVENPASNELGYSSKGRDMYYICDRRAVHVSELMSEAVALPEIATDTDRREETRNTQKHNLNDPREIEKHTNTPQKTFRSTENKCIATS